MFYIVYLSIGIYAVMNWSVVYGVRERRECLKCGESLIPEGNCIHLNFVTV